MEYKFSVIVPCYNCEKTLPETIDCLLGQSLHSEIQIILVNDGSSDGTGEIIGKYENNYGNILSVSKENGGVSSARNAGIALAEGKYTLFLDADDLLTGGSLDAIYKKMENTGADMGVFRLMRFGFGGKEYNPVVDSLAKEDEISCYDRRLMWTFSPGNKCYKTSVLKDSGVLYPPTRFREDGAFMLSFIFTAFPGITGIYDAVNLYRQADPRTGRSVTQNVKKIHCDDFFTSTGIITEKIQKSFSDSRCTCDNKEEYLQEFYLKTCHALINHFFRKLWRIDETALTDLTEHYKWYYGMLSGDNLLRLRQTDGDICDVDFSVKKLKSSPLLSVKVKNPSPDFLFSCYEQTMPLFELVTGNPGDCKDMPNINSGKPKSGFVLKFRGQKAIDPRIFRAVILLKKHGKLSKLPGFMLKHGAFAYLKIKDMKNR